MHATLIALVSLRMTAIAPDLERGRNLRHRQVSTILLAASSALAIALSFFIPSEALWAFAINLLQPAFERWGHDAA